MSFDPDTTTVLDLVAAYPAAETIFRRYDDAAGCCLLCQGLFETVSGLAARFGLDREALITDLDTVIPVNKERP